MNAPTTEDMTERQFLRHLRRVIGRNIATLREERGISVEEFSAELGYKPESYERHERGKGDLPLTLLVKVAYLLEVHPVELLKEEEVEAVS